MTVRELISTLRCDTEIELREDNKYVGSISSAQSDFILQFIGQYQVDFWFVRNNDSIVINMMKKKEENVIVRKERM